ncbi:1-phosphatidylinositol 4 [Tropilaelaps mercedesae]|uniref:Phosphoinositide phospholipase C n=1 Tax=Tropilaelaps mercedesae TaxID=418985 RepID=A0A1V9X855_9ACAR|nr:1-phosphatidylinositol 4 [Tropilaelaps mercedesae]
MAKYFREILGDMLCAKPVGAEETELPSPEELKYKILIKGKKLPPVGPFVSQNLQEGREELPDTLTVVPDYEMTGYLSDSSEMSEQLGSGSSNEADEDKKLFNPDDVDNSNGSSNNNSCNTSREEKPVDRSESRERSVSLRRSLSRRASSRVGGGSRKHSAITPDLSDLVNYVVATQFRSFRETEKWNFNQMASFSETKCLKILSSDEGVQDFMEYTRQFLARIYPKGSRTSSTNYDPVPVFNIGCQIVALNYQTPDRSMFYNVSKFAQNGNCGYVLKPQILREGFNFNHPPAHLRRKLNIKSFMRRSDCLSDRSFLFPMGLFNPVVSEVFAVPLLFLIASVQLASVLHVNENVKFHANSIREFMCGFQIISGQHIPKPDEALEGEVVDPYVVLKIVGHPSDSRTVKTEFVKNNGFNPHWNKMFEFTINLPDLATLVFIVKDDSRTGKNLKLGKYAVPLTALRPGYRHVHLRNASFEKIVPATLFVHVSINICRDTLVRSS